MITGGIRNQFKNNISLGDKQYEKIIANKKQDQIMTMEYFDGIVAK